MPLFPSYKGCSLNIYTYVYIDLFYRYIKATNMPLFFNMVIYTMRFLQFNDIALHRNNPYFMLLHIAELSLRF